MAAPDEAENTPEPEVIEPNETPLRMPEDHLEPDTLDVPPTGRTITNLNRAHRTIT